MNTSDSHISLNRHLAIVFDNPSPKNRRKIEKNPDANIIDIYNDSNKKNEDDIKDEVNKENLNQHQYNLNDNNLIIDSKTFHFENEKNRNYIVDNLRLSTEGKKITWREAPKNFF